MKPGFIREKNTCPVLLREVYVSSSPAKRATWWRCWRTGRTAGRRGRMPHSRNRLRIVRWLILLRPRILLAVKVAVLSRSRRSTTRMYVSWRLDVARGCPDWGRSLVVPNCWYRLHKTSTVFRCTPNCLATSVWRTPASIMPTVRHLSFSFNLGMAYQRRFSKLSWFSFCTGITTMLVHMFSQQTSLRFDCCPKKKNNKKKNVEMTLAKQTNYPCNSCTDQCKWPGWIHNLPV